MRRYAPLLALPALALFGSAACDSDTAATPAADAAVAGDAGGLDTPDTTVAGLTCVGCHTDEAKLKEAVASLGLPEPKVEGTGDG